MWSSSCGNIKSRNFFHSQSRHQTREIHDWDLTLVIIVIQISSARGYVRQEKRTLLLLWRFHTHTATYCNILQHTATHYNIFKKKKHFVITVAISAAKHSQQKRSVLQQKSHALHQKSPVTCQKSPAANTH